jgi:hypothetical protein
MIIADAKTLEDLKTVHQEITDSMNEYEDAVVTREEAEFFSRERAIDFFTKHPFVPQDADLYFDGKIYFYVTIIFVIFWTR